MNARGAPPALLELATGCRREAETVSNRELKLTYLQLAEGWEELARLRRTMDAEKAAALKEHRN